MEGWRERATETDRDRETGRQTDRDRQTNRQTETEKQTRTKTETGRLFLGFQRPVNRTVSHQDREREIYTHTHTHTHTHTERVFVCVGGGGGGQRESDRERKGALNKPNIQNAPLPNIQSEKDRKMPPMAHFAASSYSVEPKPAY